MAIAVALLPAPAVSAADLPSPEALPENGMRFVVRTFSGEPLNRLYALQPEKAGRYRAVELMLHPRKPSRRVRWDSERRVYLYKEEPETAAAQKGEERALSPENLPPAFLTAAAPRDMGERVTALLACGDKTGGARIFYLDEQSFKPGSLHAINFTSTPIRIAVSQKADQSDQRNFILAPYSNQRGLRPENVWHFSSGENANGAYAMSVYALQPSGAAQRLRSTRFSLSPSIGQINVFLRDASGRYSMDSISVTP